MEVVDVDQIALLVDNQLLFLVGHDHVLMTLDRRFEQNLRCVHLFVEVVELTVSQILIIHQVPLTAAVLIAVVISFTWEVNPFRMSKFVAHEAEEALASK